MADQQLLENEFFQNLRKRNSLTNKTSTYSLPSLIPRQYASNKLETLIQEGRLEELQPEEPIKTSNISLKTDVPALLNSLTNSPIVTVAYSLRKLNNNYYGPALKVRRSLDNTESDINFDNNGNLDITALTNFVGWGDGYVVIWYDQTGANNNFEQTNPIFQPLIVQNGVYSGYIYVGLSKFLLSKNNVFYTNYLNFKNVVFQVSQVNGPSILVTTGDALNMHAAAAFQGNSSSPSNRIFNVRYQVNRDELFNPTRNDIFENMSGSFHLLYVNFAVDYRWGTQKAKLGYQNNASYDNFYVKEYVIFNGEGEYPVSQEDKTIIENNMNSYYNLF